MTGNLDKRRTNTYSNSTFSLLLKCCNLTHTLTAELLGVLPATVTRYTYKGLPFEKKERLFEILADPKKAPRPHRDFLKSLMPVYNERSSDPVFYLCPTNAAVVSCQSPGLGCDITLAVKGRRSTDIIETLKLRVANIPANRPVLNELAVNTPNHVLDLS